VDQETVVTGSSVWVGVVVAEGDLGSSRVLMLRLALSQSSGRDILTDGRRERALTTRCLSIIPPECQLILHLRERRAYA
jgi:hypothetical protein